MFPEPQSVRCAHCGQALDALRAEFVRMTEAGPLFFCQEEHARAHLLSLDNRQARPHLQLDKAGARASDGSPEPAHEHTSTTLAAETEPAQEVDAANSTATADGSAEKPIPGLPRGGRQDPPSQSLGPPLAAAPSPQPRAPLRPRALDTARRLWLWTPSLLGLALCAATWSLGEPLFAVITLLLTICVWTVLSAFLAERLSAGTLTERAQLEELLRQPACRLTKDGETWVDPYELRAGEELRVNALETLLADAIVVSGQASVRLLPGSTTPFHAVEGSRLPAGCQVVDGSLRLVCTQTGDDAAFFRLATGRQESESFLFASAEKGSQKFAVLGLFASLGLALWWTHSLSTAGSIALGNFAALANPLTPALIRQVQRKWLLALAARGVHLSRNAIDAAAQVTQCVFCTRGTVLSGEPEVAELHALRGSTEEEVLALAAGAESVVEHPAASSILRAAHARGIGPDAARGHDIVPGMGVVCFSSQGEPLIVGSRDLLLRERISIASAEELLRKLENRGRIGILVAKNGRLVGVLALHDAVRVGAKAAVQLLLDGNIEPILLSGDTRSTGEALGRALSVEHIRPEIPARERGATVKELHLGGASVAVIGHSPLDDSALSGATTPIVLDAAALPEPPGGMTVLSSDVLLAAEALLSLQRLRKEALITWALSVIPMTLGILSATSLLFPALVAPLLAALGGFFASGWVLSRRQDCSPSPRYGTPQA